MSWERADHLANLLFYYRLNDAKLRIEITKSGIYDVAINCIMCCHLLNYVHVNIDVIYWVNIMPKFVFIKWMG